MLHRIIFCCPEGRQGEGKLIEELEAICPTIEIYFGLIDLCDLSDKCLLILDDLSLPLASNKQYVDIFLQVNMANVIATGNPENISISAR